MGLEGTLKISTLVCASLFVPPAPMETPQLVFAKPVRSTVILVPAQPAAGPVPRDTQPTYHLPDSVSVPGCSTITTAPVRLVRRATTETPQRETVYNAQAHAPLVWTLQLNACLASTLSTSR